MKNTLTLLLAVLSILIIFGIGQIIAEDKTPSTPCSWKGSEDREPWPLETQL